MAIWVHGDKASMLQEAWIDFSAGAWMIGGYGKDHIIFKPLIGFGDG
jgi:hypothetical protein